jgi:hypothetical protein
MRRLVLLLTLLVAAQVRADWCRVEIYMQALEQIDTLLASGQRPEARRAADFLGTLYVKSTIGTFHADRSLLKLVGDDRVPISVARARIAFTLEELQHATGGAVTPADRHLLAEVTKAQTPEERLEGGEIKAIPADVPMVEQILDTLKRVFDWIGEQLTKLWEWLSDLWPEDAPDGTTRGLRWMITALVSLILITVAVLAFRVLRSSRRATPEIAESADSMSSDHDADPLSRGANEWERYAARLGLEGRYREGIRAWFHAVLVTCYAESILHFRKGRTNWEYIASLTASLTWRPELIALTRQFEHEWYGRSESTAEVFEDCALRARTILDALHKEGAAA